MHGFENLQLALTQGTEVILYGVGLVQQSLKEALIGLVKGAGNARVYPVLPVFKGHLSECRQLRLHLLYVFARLAILQRHNLAQTQVTAIQQGLRGGLCQVQMSQCL